ncbi:adenylyl-sulfate kinase [Agarivorans sp. B2Z047]|uniref:adenylyl-sulfate kinase n=1 Tax=Agarivorans sp. B2Z047 TaxID=2652721 RepID=UPI00128D066F|nr:adenylyl-sulfate kinase [Agarivorans sp. B2Z047]MPW28725.1 adenylyl-sulfate kinase [Agarivorans sp. B2Z047]UQN41286.1 adenylyl-sulfate kinase [Agarivorans sp. B2Z047]
MDTKSENVVWHAHSVSRDARSEVKQHKPCVLWFTGLSGSGKSTVANAVDHLLHKRKVHTYVLDGDNVRHGLNGDLGFSDKDRVENIRRIGEVAKLFVDAGLVVSTAFISPFKADRDLVRNQLSGGEFFEVFIDTPLEVCEQRDPKGLYKKARAGEIKHFTGIDSAYEIPTSPDIHVKTDGKTIEECAAEVIAALEQSGIIS